MVPTKYHATFNRPNVRLIDVMEFSIARITPSRLEDGGGACVCNCLVFAAGFDAMTGALEKLDLRGRG